MKEITLYILCLCLLAPVASFAEQAGILHLDRPYYFSGEAIFFSVFLGNVQTDSSMILMNIWHDDQLLEEHFHVTTQGHFDGYVKLPHAFPTSLLILQAFAFEVGTARPIELFREAVSVFGDSMSHESFVSTPVPLSAFVYPDIQLSFSADSFLSRNPITCTLSHLPPETSAISVGIRKQGTGVREMSNVRAFRHHLDQLNCMRQLPIRGALADVGDSSSQTTFLLAYQSGSLHFASTLIDQQGLFHVGVPGGYRHTNMQFLDCLNAYPIKTRSVNMATPATPDILAINDSSIGQEYSLYQRRKHIYQLFGQLPRTLIPLDTSEVLSSIAADAVVDVQDYTVQGKISELFREILTPLVFRRKKGSIRVFYRSKDGPIFYPYPPLFIVNGVATQDVDFINSLELQQLKTVHIYSELATVQSLIGSCHIGGLVVIELMDAQYQLPDEQALPTATFPGLQSPIAYPIMNDPESTLPRLQSLVYWSPSQQIAAGDSLNVSFGSTDLEGAYQMDVVVQDRFGKLFLAAFPLVHDSDGWRWVAKRP